MIEKSFTVEDMRNLIQGATDDFETVDVLIDGKSYPVKVRTIITQEEREEFISSVVSNCVRNGSYSKEDFNWVFDINFLNTMTDLPLIPSEDDPEQADIKENYLLIQKIDIGGHLNEKGSLPARNAYAELYFACEAALDFATNEDWLKKIEPRVQAMNELGDMAQAFRELLESLLNGANTFFSDEVKKQFLETFIASGGKHNQETIIQKADVKVES